MVKQKSAAYIQHILAANSSKLKSFGVKQIGVFGSVAKNEQHPNSDIDILVSLDKESKTLRNFLSLAYYLEDLLQNKVDLVTKESLSKYVKNNILDTVLYVPLTN
jgi:hypothetical protein